MDILFNKLTLLIAAITIVTVFLVYSITRINRIGSNAYFKAISQVCKVFTRALGTLATALLGLLASSAKTSDTNEATGNAARGGVLNYRTDKLDDGTDPYGWYNND